jgi:hypothetical protein
MIRELQEAYKDLKFKWYSAKRRGNFVEADKYKHLMKNFKKQYGRKSERTDK